MEQHRRVGDGNAAVAVDVRRTELRDGQPSGARHIIEKKLRVLVGHAAVAVDVAEQAGGGRKSEQRARQQRRQQQRGKNPSYPIQDGSPPLSRFLTVIIAFYSGFVNIFSLDISPRLPYNICILCHGIPKGRSAYAPQTPAGAAAFGGAAAPRPVRLLRTDRGKRRRLPQRRNRRRRARAGAALSGLL